MHFLFASSLSSCFGWSWVFVLLPSHCGSTYDKKRSQRFLWLSFCRFFAAVVDECLRFFFIVVVAFVATASAAVVAVAVNN